jgi:DNA-binding CsgD family transcriptional regulator
VSRITPPFLAVPIVRDDIYRIAREAIRNAHEHATASHIETEIGFGETDFRVRVRDDGIGLAREILRAGQRAGHWGLPAIRERSESIGGRRGSCGPIDPFAPEHPRIQRPRSRPQHRQCHSKRCRNQSRRIVSSLQGHDGALNHRAERRIAQADDFYLQAPLPVLLYASTMSSADEAIAPFGDDRETGQASAGPALLYLVSRRNRALSLPVNWDIRRALIRARSALINMQLHDATREMERLRRLLSNRGERCCTRYTRALAIMQASILAAKDEFSAARKVLMSVDWQADDTLAATILRYVNWKHGGDPEEAWAPDTADYLTAPVGGKAVPRILSLCVSAALAFDHLQLAVSANLATEALQLARLRYGNQSPMSTFPATLLAQVAYEQGRSDEAEALLRPRIALIRASGLLECVARASVLLARLSLHRGRPRAALAVLRETEALGLARCWPRLVSIASSEHSRILDALHYDQEQRSASRASRVHRELFRAAGARHAQTIAESLRAPETLQIGLRAQQPSTRARNDSLPHDQAVCYSAVETALRRASSTASLGSLAGTCEFLIPCLRIGAARGLCMAFVDAGRPLLVMLEQLYYALPTNDPQLSDLRPYIATLLRSTHRSNSEEAASVTYRSLSRRETGILQMIARGMSNKRIAQSLGITPETVKSHAKSIFVKLASRTRAQAVSRAEAVGFL